MNGATEATLQELLAVAQSMSANIVKLNSMFSSFQRSGGMSSFGGGGGGAGAAAGALGSLTKAAGPLGIAFSVVSTAAKAVGAIFEFLGSIVGKVIDGLTNTIGNLVAFSIEAMNGTASMSKLWAAFKDLPFFIGTVAELFSKITSYNERIYKTYSDLAKSGASFGGDLYKMAITAAKTYMTLEQFSKVVKENSDVFSSAIGGVEAGFKKFQDAQIALVDPRGKYGKALAGLGVSAEEAADMLAVYTRVSTSTSKKGVETSQQQAAATYGLITQLDAYSKLTGESREAMEKKLKDAAFDESLNAFLSTMTGPEKIQAMLSLESATKAGGKGLRDQVATMIMSNGQIKQAGTEAAMNYRLTAGEQGQAAAETFFKLSRTVGDTTEATRLQALALKQAGDGTRKFIDGIGGPKMAGLLTAQGINLGIATEQFAAMNRSLREVNGAETPEEKAARIMKEQETQFKSFAAQVAAAELEIKKFGSALLARVLQIGGPLSKKVAEWSEKFATWSTQTLEELLKPGGAIDKAANWFNTSVLPQIEEIAKWFNDVFGKLAKTKSPEEFWKTLKEVFKEGMDNVWKVIGPPIVDFWEKDFKPAVLKVFEGMLDWIISALRKNSMFMRFLFGETNSEKISKAEAEIDRNKNSLLQNREYIDRMGLPGGPTEQQARSLARQNAELEEKNRNLEAQIRQITGQTTSMGAPVARALTTLGATGKFWEGEKTVRIGEKEPESVINQEVFDEVVRSSQRLAGGNNLADHLIQLNKTTAQLARIMGQVVENTRDAVNATRGLNGNFLA